jgi:TRAP-type mannitol/chloroaromatic compound transport system permease small subunit
MGSIVRGIEAFTEYTGRWIALLILPLVLVVLYEVMMRRVFNMPTSWAFEVTVWLYGAHFMLGMAYTMLYDRHVRIDIIVLQMPERVQLWLRVLTMIFIFLPFVGFLAVAAVQFAVESWAIGEHSWTAWKPPLYPYKTVMPLALIMLLVQGLASLYRDIRKLQGGDR